jgi:hypothetical protein
MKCHEIQLRISEWVDGDATEAESILLQHMKVCENCATFCQDIRNIKEEARGLDLFEPPDRVWANLRDQLVSDGMIRTREKKRGPWGRIFSGNLWPGLKPAFSGAIVALILSTSVFYFYLRQAQPPSGPSTEAVVFQELRQAELHYQKAIEALSDVSQRKIENMDPAMAQILNDNLATMDYYVKECQEAVKNNPDNPLVHRYLLTAYQKKIEIMQSIVNSDVL